jgi:CO dehydrogenase/acetyl-CoA synthase beta subunit
MKKIIYLGDYLADLYLDWVNNFLTIEKFSEYYGLEEDDAKKLLEVAKKSHEQRIEYSKFLEEELE